MTRKTELPIDPGNLPKIDAVLLSHLHFDHFENKSYRYIHCNTPIICPPKTSSHIRKFLSNPLIEIDYFATHKLPSGEEITALPAKHFSIPLTRFEHTVAYAVKSPEGTFYFCGDSAYGKHFSEAGSVYAPDLAILPIGAYKPTWLLKKSHMTPPEAIQAFSDLKAKHMLPIHHSTFKLTLENPDEPQKWLKKILDKNPNLKNKVHTISPGNSINIDV